MTMKPTINTTMVLALLVGQPLAGQHAELRLLGGTVSDEAGTHQRGLTLAPAVSWAGSGGWLRIAGQATAFEQGGFLVGTRLDADALLVRAGAAEIAVRGSGSAVDASSGYRSLAGELSPRAQLRSATAGLAAGAILSGAVRSLPDGAPALPGLPIGSGPGRSNDPLAAHGAFAEAWLDGLVSLRLRGQAMDGESVAWQEAHVGLSIDLGEVELGTGLGRRFGAAGESWAGAGVAARLSSRTTLLGEVGRYPSDPLTGQAGGRHATVGLRIATGSPQSRAVESPMPPYRTMRLALSAAPGATVEVLGDWNEWQPEPAAEARAGWYVFERRLAPGTYRFVLRVDGELRIPDGYDTAPDAFGGTSAVVRVGDRR
jgi:hypothetical protein